MNLPSSLRGTRLILFGKTNIRFIARCENKYLWLLKSDPEVF